VYSGEKVEECDRNTAPVYIKLQDTPITASQGEKGTGTYDKYLIYTSGTNTVRVKIISAAINPANASFDKNPAGQTDVSATITWNDALSVTDIKAGGTTIGTAGYSVSGNTLNIKKEYLA
jgi:hypothetical protein